MNKVSFSSLRNADTFYLEDNDSDEYRLLNAYVKVDALSCFKMSEKKLVLVDSKAEVFVFDYKTWKTNRLTIKKQLAFRANIREEYQSSQG